MRLLDAALVTLFVFLGQRTHDSAGLGQSVAPFLVALLISWAITYRQHIADLWPTGVIVWVITAGGGLAIRAVTGGGVSGGFPYVTFGVLAGFLLGWRLLALPIRRARQKA